MPKKQAIVADPLDALAEQINAAHRQCVEAATSALAHAKRAGELLNDAKGRCHHGRWLPWLKASFAFSEKTAQNYMRVAREWEKLTEGNPQRVADLSYREALRLLEAPPAVDGEAPPVAAKPGACRPLAAHSLEDRREVALKWWDILAQQTIVCDAAGWTHERIAEFMGVPVRDVELILHPRPPMRFDTEANGAEMFTGSHGAIASAQHAYRNAVEHFISGMLYTMYLSAPFTAEREGLDGVSNEMLALARFHKQRAAHLGWEIFDCLTPRRLGVIACACAITDARAALGIEDARHGLVELWEEMEQVVEEEETA